MPIKIELAIREGWKAQQNARFADALEIRFINEADDRILFRYAPKCEDEAIFNEMFTLLKEYDSRVKLLREIHQNIDGRAYNLQGAPVDNGNNKEGGKNE